MKKLASLFLLTLVASITAIADSRRTPDVLGQGYEMRYVAQPADYSGEVRSTIVRKLSPCGSKRGVLYVHGFNDYFFQAEMGNRFVDSCYNFFAVDLRKYGPSLMPGQTPFEVRNVKEYFADIDSAVAEMTSEGITEIVLMGHSTGGLITACYMNANPPREIKALMLNSPFLDWNLSKTQEHLLVPMVNAAGRLMPGIKIKQDGSTAYTESLLKKYGGEWSYNTDWKMEQSPDVNSGWISAIDRAQAIIQGNPHIRVPILLMHSNRTAGAGASKEELASSDAVLDVADISRYGRRLGPLVTEITVNGGLHDLMLSKPQVRESLYDYIFKWLDGIGV